MYTSRHAALALSRAASSFINSSSHFRGMAESCLRAPQPFQLAPPDPAFLVDAGTAASQHIKLLLVRQELDVDPITHRLARPLAQSFVQIGQPSFRSADQI